MKFLIYHNKYYKKVWSLDLYRIINIIYLIYGDLAISDSNLFEKIGINLEDEAFHLLLLGIPY